MPEETKTTRFAIRLTAAELRRWEAVRQALEARSVSEAVRLVMASTANDLLGKPKKERKKP